jgi:hypothetical protein
MEKIATSNYKKRFIIVLIALLAVLGIGFFMQVKMQAKMEAVTLAMEDQQDTLAIMQHVVGANALLLKGEKDSALAMYALYDSIDWVTQLKDQYLWLVDSLLNQKVVVREVVQVPVEHGNAKRSIMPPETEALIGALSEEIAVSKNKRDSMERNATRERAEWIKRMAEMEKSNDWKYLKFYKKTKGMYVNYVGQLKNGAAEGNGVGIYASGSVYRGQWKNGLRHGEGIFEWADGEKYEGEYVEDARQGYGTYYWSNGLRYEGQWINDKREGTGTLYDKNNKIVAEGAWKNDKVVKK